ncbi:hypothetical protein Sjap_011321 [Stephania japonica]|uniref:Uncharacterized protein n=1 Tax=Stephania japonica TaxID=461633 RepID=A0AAP0JBG0_9MAGN
MKRSHQIRESSGAKPPNPLDLDHRMDSMMDDSPDQNTWPYRLVSEVRKIKMPTFNREDLLIWLNQVGQYFQLHELLEVSKLRVA